MPFTNRAGWLCVSFAVVVSGTRVSVADLDKLRVTKTGCTLATDAQKPKDVCEVNKYYEGVDMTAEALHAKIKGQRVLLYGTTKEDDPEYDCANVWNSLDFLDESKEDSSKVDLLYSKHPAEKHLKSVTHWNREHVWPKSYGASCKVKRKEWINSKKKGVKCKKKKKYVDDNGSFTDLHHLFPSHAGVNSDRSSQYFDACTPATCNYDHNTEDGYTAQDEDAGESNDDTTFWQPPEKSRGVVARALFYMALRYNGDEPNTFDLTLTDHPSYCSEALGKLSVLKEWHEKFPPTEAEKERNAKACWMQGNRNPFVDHPDLVEKLFGAEASPHLVTANPDACDGPHPRAKMCDPNAGWINECTPETKPGR